MSEKTPVARTVARVVWHLLRYAVATGASTVALAVLPALAVLVFVFSVLFSFVLVLVGLAPIDEPMSLLFTPLLTVVFGIAAILAIFLLAVAFTVLSVLPISLFTEFVCWRLDIQHILARLASFVPAGVLLGMAVSGLGLLWVQPGSPDSAALIIIVLTLVSVCVVFLFGLVLTLMTAIRDGTLALWRAVKQKQATGHQ